MARYYAPLMALTALSLMACTQEPAALPETDAPQVDVEDVVPIDPSIVSPTDDLYLTWQLQSLQRCQDGYGEFKEAVLTLAIDTDSFLNEPSAAGLAQTQSSWQLAAEKWGMADLCSHRPLATDSATNFAARYQRTVAAPALPGYLDSIPDYTDTGIVNDNTVTLSLESLEVQHQISFEEEVALGLYAVEVLLFGVEPRSADDFIMTTEEGASTTRRAGLLRLITNDLLTQAEIWHDNWPARISNVRRTYSTTYQLTWLIDNWILALEKVARASARVLNEEPGLALHPMHDHVRFKGTLAALHDWMAQPDTLRIVETFELPMNEWQSTVEQTATWLETHTVDTETTSDLTALQPINSAAIQHLRAFREVTENTWHTLANSN